MSSNPSGYVIIWIKSSFQKYLTRLADPVIIKNSPCVLSISCICRKSFKVSRSVLFYKQEKKIKLEELIQSAAYLF